MRIARAIVPGLVLLVGLVRSSPARQIDYRNWDEGALVMIVQSILYDEAKLYLIGESSTPGIYQTAMLIAENADIEDGGTKNAVLFECGMHSREWFPTEACYWLIDYLLRNRNSTEVHELLSHVDVWVIPQTNPAGRDIDDLRGGDPTQFAYVCDIGVNSGQPCSTDADCPGGGCWTKGWRGNANRAACGVGVDLARNFSTGWDRAASLCTQRLCVGWSYDTTNCTDSGDCSAGDACKNVRMQFRGPQPFSEPESRNVRRFVNNHMLSMVTVVHANSHEIWNLWYDANGASAYMTDSLLAMNTAGSASYSPDPSMFVDGVGGSFGQFSGWLTGESDVAGELDQGTRRNISTFYLELPVMDDRYEFPYRNSSTDNSNGLHPSSTRMEGLWEAAIRDMFLYLIQQARSPQCPINPLSGLPITIECETNDFGLVGAKIANATDEPGLLDYNSQTREETLPSGTRQVVFAVQNLSANAASTSTNAMVTITKDGNPDGTPVVPVSLARGDRATFSVSHSFATGADYRVAIALDADDFVRNNSKIFAFTVTDAWPTYRRVVGWSRLRLRHAQQGSNSDQMNYRGKFLLDVEPEPESSGMDILIRGRAPHVFQQASPSPILYSLPSGSPWWDRSKPETGRWLYTDPDGQNGPVTKLLIKQHGKPATGDRLTRVVFKVKNDDLSGLSGARSYTVDLSFTGKGLMLASMATGPRVSLPDKQIPADGETEDEPHAEQ